MRKLHFYMEAGISLLISVNLDYSRVEVAVDAKCGGCSCGISPQIRRNKATSRPPCYQGGLACEVKNVE